VTILKRGGASTLDIIDGIKNQILPASRAAAPPGLEIKELFDQSVFVRAAMRAVALEGVIVACLVAAVILLFLGSWRSTLIIAASIPLSLFCSVIALYALGYTFNVMTLGGLALAIGILVDDVTVEIENIHRNMKPGRPLREAILNGASQIAVPTFVSTLTICIVFVAVIFLTGPARFLFVPMALAVVFSVAASYLLSRTFVPVMALLLLPAEQKAHDEGSGVDENESSQNVFGRLSSAFTQAFERFRQSYVRSLSGALHRRFAALIVAVLVLASALAPLPFVGRDFFPTVDAGQFRLHVRAAPGTRIESTERLFEQVNDEIRRAIPPEELSGILDNIGLNLVNTFNLGLGDASTISTFDGEILVSLKPGHQPTANRLGDLCRSEWSNIFARKILAAFFGFGGFERGDSVYSGRFCDADDNGIAGGYFERGDTAFHRAAFGDVAERNGDGEKNNRLNHRNRRSAAGRRI
jgi:multidrug efflux pump subunit AcrB